MTSTNVNTRTDNYVLSKMYLHKNMDNYNTQQSHKTLHGSLLTCRGSVGELGHFLHYMLS